MARLLLIGQRPARHRLCDALRLRGHQLELAASIGEVQGALGQSVPDMAIIDGDLGEATGIELLRQTRNLHGSLPTIVIAERASIEEAVEATRLGALEYITQPMDHDALVLLVERALESEGLRAERAYLLEQVFDGENDPELVGGSVMMQQVRQMLRLVAGTPHANVLLTGESGTGKELAAYAIHQGSPNRSRPFIKVNCPAIPAQLFESELFGHMRGAFTGAIESRKGKFELAAGGDIFLDEVSEIPLDLQAKLLRVLEDRTLTPVGGSREVRVDARVIAATNRDLRKMVSEGRFREDLFYRLHVFPVRMPPLRERREDIPETANHLLRHVTQATGLKTTRVDESAMSAFVAYDWPGNARELRNILERACILAGNRFVGVEHLPSDLGGTQAASGEDTDFIAQVERYKRSLLLQALRSTAGNKKMAAAKLGLTQRAFSHYVVRYDLDGV